ncbi:MAG: ABC transporter [Silanimonas sp.]|nr:MAG: ABC transporter [Silanimonas sp.]
MSSDVVISVHGLGKTYAMYERPHHRLLELIWGAQDGRWRRTHDALREVSFEVRRGETVGIVGQNGSGKSTLLEILCGTLTPSVGAIEVCGRVAALLELGAGFNPEFSGRENVFLNGTVLGLTREEVASRFEAIVAFADIGDFIDQPVRTYSSGMFVRLAFAVAISVDPDILIVDEALSVGDEAFQRKCFARIEQLRERGATILFVSHSAGTVVDLCDRALWLDRGELLADGPAREVVAQYQRFVHAPEDRRQKLRMMAKAGGVGFDGVLPSKPELRSLGKCGGADEECAAPVEPELIDAFDATLVAPATVVYENLGARILEPRIETFEGRRVNLLVSRRRYVYRYSVEFDATATGVRFGMMLRTVTGGEVGGAASCLPSEAIPVVERGSRIDVSFEFDCALLPGTYFLNAGVLAQSKDGEQYLDRRIDTLMFRVLPLARSIATGMVDLAIRPSWRSSAESDHS